MLRTGETKGFIDFVVSPIVKPFADWCQNKEWMDTLQVGVHMTCTACCPAGNFCVRLPTFREQSNYRYWHEKNVQGVESIADCVAAYKVECLQISLATSLVCCVLCVVAGGQIAFESHNTEDLQVCVLRIPVATTRCPQSTQRQLRSD